MAPSSTRKLGCEGIVSKRLGSPYRSGGVEIDPRARHPPGGQMVEQDKATGTQGNIQQDSHRFSCAQFLARPTVGNVVTPRGS